jgi:membrane-associated phospholipid phosphatase
MISKRTVAVWISNLSHPVLLVALSVVYITSRYVGGLEDVIRYSTAGLALIVVIPSLVYVILARHYEHHVDMDITNRADRPLPLLLASLGALIAGSIISNRINDVSLLFISQTLVAMLLLLTVVSLVWKISIHTSTLAALVTLMVIFRGEALLPLYLIVLPVAWARLQLHKHTAAQLAGGSLLGVAVTYLLYVAIN